MTLLFSCLVLTAAAATRPSAQISEDAMLPKQTQPAATSGSIACEAIHSQWPGIIAEAEALYREQTWEAAKARQQRLEAQLKALASQECPAWATPVAVQRALLRESSEIFAITHAADATKSALDATTLAELTKAYYTLNDETCLWASTRLETAWAVYRSQDEATPRSERRQRYLTNLQTLEAFVALARTRVLAGLEGQLDCLQGQGPYGAEAAEKYVTAAIRYARKHAVDRVVFVNAAGGQVPSFAKQVEKGAEKAQTIATYTQYDGWKDGTLVQPPQAVAFTEKLIHRAFDPHKKTLLVINCNAGMDRSGTLNALTQLILATQRDLANGTSIADAVKQGFAAIPTAVRQIKQARPHAISSLARYTFIYGSYACYAKTLSQPM
jgi:hypothetical protein